MKTYRAALGLAVASLAAISACSSDDPSSETASPSNSAEAAPAADAVAADQSLPPVVVGFSNLESAVVSLPEIRKGFEASVEYVNAELGGINGHPLEFEFCATDITPDSSVDCANQFVEADVAAVVMGIDIAPDAALPVLRQAGIPVIGIGAFTPAADHAVGDAFFVNAAPEETLASDLLVQQMLGAETVALVNADTPGIRAIVDDLGVPLAEELGLELQQVYYPVGAEWTSLAATIVASDPDAVDFPAAEDTVCSAAVPALRSAGFTGVILASSCTQFIDEVSLDQLENVVTSNSFYSPAITVVPDKPAKDLEVFDRYVPEPENRTYAQLGFAVGVDAATMLQQVEGDVTAAALKGVLPRVQGDSFFRDNDNGYDCSDPAWPGTTSCAGGLLYTKITADRRRELIPDAAPLDLSDIRPDR